jgi:dTDP-4-amino-4,6-dideoxygalactose transaminase
LSTRPRRNAIAIFAATALSPNAAIIGSSSEPAAPGALLTHSCTSALDLAALLLDIESGDEVILPSYTFVSTANAFVLRGAVPVVVDIREDTLNLDERLIEAAITPRTRAIVPVHYAGVSCEMDTILAIAGRRSVDCGGRGAGNHGGL